MVKDVLTVEVIRLNITIIIKTGFAGAVENILDKIEGRYNYG